MSDNNAKVGRSVWLTSCLVTRSSPNIIGQQKLTLFGRYTQPRAQSKLRKLLDDKSLEVTETELANVYLQIPTNVFYELARYLENTPEPNALEAASVLSKIDLKGTLLCQTN